jgi:hypothetical protein
MYTCDINAGWWFGTFGLFFPFSWEFHFIPTDYIIFFRGVSTTNQNGIVMGLYHSK